MLLTKDVEVLIPEVKVEQTHKRKFANHIGKLLATLAKDEVITKNNLCEWASYDVGVSRDENELVIFIKENRNYSFLHILKSIFFVFTNGFKPLFGLKMDDMLNVCLLVADIYENDNEIVYKSTEKLIEQYNKNRK